MAIVLGKPGVDGLNEAAGVLREWQYEGAPMQLHPGDLGWFWRFGAEAYVEAPMGARVHDLLSGEGWGTDEP